MKKIILGLYILFLLFFTVFSYFFIDPNLIYMKSIYTGLAFSQRQMVTAVYIISIFLFFTFYGIFLNFLRKNVLTLRDFKIITGVTVLVLFLSYPAMVSYDIFNYIATAKVLFLYHENPYLIMPIQFTGDPLLLFMHAANKTALYGPFWILLTGIPYFLGLGNFIITLFSFKLFTVIFYLASVWLLYKMTKNIFLTSIFTLNPLVILETLVSGHNDIVMMFFALLSIYFLKDKKFILFLIFFVLSVFIKFSTLFLIPVFGYVIYYYLKNKKVEWEKVYYLSSLFMLLIFFLSPIREEMYPWYSTWFLIFIPLIQNRLIKYIYLAFSFGLLFRDIPFMLIGTYFGPTPMLKIIFTFIPVTVSVIYIIFKYLWPKYRYR